MMSMTLILDEWETLSLTAGCNLYSKNFRFCVLTVRAAEEGNSSSSPLNRAMYYKERDKPVVDVEAFLSTAVPKLLLGFLIIFLNSLAISSMIRNNRTNRLWISSKVVARNRFYILPQSTQGLLNSLFVTYLLHGILILYSQFSLSLFILGDYRIFDDPGRECLAVNSLLLSISVAIALHLASLSVDRTLSSYLSYVKYTKMTQGTIPLWLLAIWLPSTIIGSLPLAGWTNNFSFCLFLHQFNDNYLKFVSGFYFITIAVIPALYLFFLLVLKPVKEDKTLYRWYRKLQAHHKLTFLMVLVVNILCWSPFHIYLSLACLTCVFSSLANGFFIEYLSIFASLPSIIIPLVFIMRSSNLRDHCVRFSKFQNYEERNYSNPLSASALYDTKNNMPTSLYVIGDNVGSKRQYQWSNGSIRKPSPFFVPRYFPPLHDVTNELQVKKNSAATKIALKPHYNNDFNDSYLNYGTGIYEKNEKNKASQQRVVAPTSQLNKKRREKDNKLDNNSTVVNITAHGCSNGKNQLKNFCAYLNQAYVRNEVGKKGTGKKGGDTQDVDSDSDSRAGFPMSDEHPVTLTYTRRYARKANNTKT